MDQVRITEPTDLLDRAGNVAKPGYCELNRYVYRRAAVRGNKTRIKEWDFYQIADSTYTLQFNIADISLAGAFTFALFNRKTGERVDYLSVAPLTFGRIGLEEDNTVPYADVFHGPGCYAKSEFTGDKRFLDADFKHKGDRYVVHAEIEVMPGLHSLTMALPFEKKGHFYLNQKVNSMPCTCRIEKNGEEFVTFEQGIFCTLDWGRGVWPHSVTWYWGNGTTRLPDGHLFGFEIGWGFGDMSAATENMLFYDGVGHKIEEVYLKRDPDNFLMPWVFTSNDGRFEMTMTPTYDNYSNKLVLGLAGSIGHQVWGTWNGRCILDDGTVIEVHDMLAFCEYIQNKW